MFLIWLGLENWCKHSVSAFIGATLRYIANFRGEAAFDLLLRLVFTLKSFYLWLLVCNSRSLLCITFIFVYFSVGFIWKDGSNVVSSLLVILLAIHSFVTNFSRRVVYLKVCYYFYL